MENEVTLVYKNMYQWMIEKDIEKLGSILDEGFTLTHMTGMIQNKKEYLEAIRSGILNYYFVSHDKIEIEDLKDYVRLSGKSRVTAKVFGGDKHTWRLCQVLKLKNKNNHWVIQSAVASTY
ncbi:MAG: nuclear transport factor 2 family protein [Anaeroplasmataceae bacterium]|nr:nuclear transport factor 2 family protein [Anaeroplasmataceae bacterium]